MQFFSSFKIIKKIMEEILKTQLLLVCCLLLQTTLVVAPPSKPKCPEPSLQQIQDLFQDYHKSNPVYITEIHFTCLAVRGIQLYDSASVVIQYNTTMSTNESLRFELKCKSKSNKMTWERSSMPQMNTNYSLFNLKTRYNCFECVSPVPPRPHHKDAKKDIDTVAHCRECHENCHGWGGGYCKSPSPGSCCPYFDAEGKCSQVCPHNYTNCDGECMNYWTGSNCSECSIICYNGGTPNITNCSSCICPPEFTSTFCEDEIDKCQLQCQNNGTCIIEHNGNYSCNCTKGFMGPLCEEDIDECDKNPCENGGSCTSVEGEVVCICPPGFTGPYCNECMNYWTGSNCSECSITCYNGGRPNLTNCSSCICPPGFTGSNCEISDKEDCSDKCLNGGTCVNISGNYTCMCSPGYIGPNCSKVDPCESSPCLNGGKCKIDSNDRFVCECIDGWSGDICQHCDDSDFSDCIPSTTISPLQEESKTGVVVAIVFSVLGLVAIATLISALFLLYKRYQRHKDAVKIANINEDIWDGATVMTNPVYMNPEVLNESVTITSGDTPLIANDNEVIINEEAPEEYNN